MERKSRYKTHVVFHDIGKYYADFDNYAQSLLNVSLEIGKNRAGKQEIPVGCVEVNQRVRLDIIV